MPFTKSMGEVEAGSERSLEHQFAGQLFEPGARIGLLIRDAVHRQLLDGVARQLELIPEDLSLLRIEAMDAGRFAMVIADEDQTASLQAALTAAALRNDLIPPAVIGLVAPGSESARLRDAASMDGVITLGQDPASLLVQMRLMLHAYRAFARKYRMALNELHLNRRIFRSVTSGISVADATEPDLPLTYVNPAFETMTGYSLESIEGKNCRFLQGEEQQQPGLDELREAIKQRRHVTVTLRNYRKDGTQFWNELFLTPIRNREGELTHYVGIQNDVSARLGFEAALRESEKLAAVGRLAASIAHEINNPLESVMNLLYLAQQETSIAGVKTHLAQADAEVRRVALVTTQSLRFYRQNTRPAETDCDALLTSTLDLYTQQLLHSPIDLLRSRATHETVFCMESEIRQVLSNLVRNAIDALHATGGRLTARTRTMTEWRSGRRGVAITVADTGTGISSQNLSKLYTAFFTTKADTGTGLGLWVSANIVERHRGRLMVRSSTRPENHGTVFTVFLPFDAMRERRAG